VSIFTLALFGKTFFEKELFKTQETNKLSILKKISSVVAAGYDVANRS
jgi:hypothetical protein